MTAQNATQAHVNPPKALNLLLLNLIRYKVFNLEAPHTAAH